MVVADDGPLVSRLCAAGIETYVLPMDQTVLETRKESLGLKSLLRLRQMGSLAAYTVRLARWAKRHQVDLIHTNSLKSDIYGGIAGRLAHIPVLWHIRDHVNGKYLPPLIAALFRHLSRWLPQVVVVNSESTLRQLWPSRAASGAASDSGVVTQVVHDGYREENSEPAASAPRPVSGQYTVALIGRIAEWKGQRVFLRAAASLAMEYPQARFWIVGAPLFGEHDYER